MGHDADDLTRWLADRDVPCPLCGYNLRGLTGDRCPECGQPLRLSVALAEPYLKPWLTLAASLLVPAGLGILWACLVPFLGLPGRRRDQATVLLPILYQIATIPLAGLVIWRRRSIQRWSRGSQWRVAGLAALLAVVSFVTVCVLFH